MKGFCFIRNRLFETAFEMLHFSVSPIVDIRSGAREKLEQSQSGSVHRSANRLTIYRFDVTEATLTHESMTIEQFKVLDSRSF